jgi:hypothetical protein
MTVENRESFFQRLYPFFSPKILRDIELAYILAKAAHRSQVRTIAASPCGTSSTSVAPRSSGSTSRRSCVPTR